jgi:hypothetical protein
MGQIDALARGGLHHLGKAQPRRDRRHWQA